MMGILPTRRFWMLVLAGIPLALLGAFIGGMERLVLPYNIVLLGLLFGSRAMLGNLYRIQVVRQTDKVLSVRAKNKVDLSIANTGKIPLRGFFHDAVPATFESEGNEGDFHLGPGETRTLHYRVRPTERGREVFEGTHFRFLAPLGLCTVDHYVESIEEIDVYPNLKALEEFDLLKRKGRLSQIGVRRTRYRGLGTEFESLRDYENDDDYRRIDWKSSARRGKFVVREYELERNQAVMLIIDVGRGMLAEADGTTKLDHVLDSALLLMHAVDAAGDQVGLLVYAERVLHYIPPRRGKLQIQMILNAIHNLHARPVESEHWTALSYYASRWKRRALTIWFSEIGNPDEARRVIQAVTPMRHRHLWFLARVRDPRLNELALQPLTTVRNFYQRAAFSWYDRQSKEASIMLRNHFPESIESEPQDLAAALVGAYIDAKQKAAI